MKVERTKESKFTPDSLNIKSFGNMFGDHMLVCHYKDDAWGDAEILPFQNMSFSPALQALHYGQSCFEGMKAYKSESGDVFLFRPEKNFERINISAMRLDMPPVPKDVFMDGLQKLIDLDRQWVPDTYGMSLYIRPFIFATEPMITARSSKEYMFCIITAVAPDYYAKPLRVKVADRYSRASPGGVGYAKAAGNYAAAFYPTRLARDEQYDQVIWTDSSTHKIFEEAGTMNVFVRIDDTLYTAPISERILNGVTRNSIIALAQRNGWKVVEEAVTVDQVKEAHKNNSLKEVFGVGTAVVLNTFSAIGFKDAVCELEDLPFEDSWGKQLKKQLMDIQFGVSEDPFGWRVLVEPQND